MAALFAEAFAEPLQEAARPTLEHRYDEELGLSVLPDGRVFVEHASAGETQTVTKATGESDDRDEDTTITEADAETDTWRTLMEGTHTAVKAEADDWAATRKGTETLTFVDAESDDWTTLPSSTLTRASATRPTTGRRSARGGRRVLLIVTNRDDHTADWLIAELHRRGAPFVRFNTEDYPPQVRLRWTLGHSARRTPHRRGV